MTDPIADMLSRIRNATTSRRPRVDIPVSKLKLEIARILQNEGYIHGFKLFESTIEGGSYAQKTLRIALKYGPRGERVHHDAGREVYVVDILASHPEEAGMIGGMIAGDERAHV